MKNDEKSQSVWDLLRATWKTGRLLPTDSAARKQFPLATGVDDYIPAALVCFAALSKVGNDKHNPGEPLHHARDKSSDHSDCLRRHQLDAGDPAADELEEAVCAFWRAGMRVQLLAEKLGAPKAPGAR